MTGSGRAARWRLQAEVLLWRQGWLATALLLSALLGLAHEAWQWQRAAAALQALREQATHSANSAASADASSAPTRPAEGPALGEQLPPAAAPAEAVERLLQVSRQAGLPWPRASHRADDSTDGPTRWRVTQTTPSDYPTLRQAVLATLATLPHVSLDRLSARRDAEGRASLNSTLEWSLWAAPHGAAAALPGAPPGWRLRERTPAGDAAPPRDLFATRAPMAPALPDAAPPPPTPPEPALAAPPPPPDIRVLGKQWDGEHWRVFVSEGPHTRVLREGDTLQDGQRVERIDPPTLLLRRDGAEAAQPIPIGEAR